MCSHKSNSLEQILAKLARLNMNSTYIKFLVRKLRTSFVGHGKTSFLQVIYNCGHSRPKPETSAPGRGQRIMTTDEVNQSRLLDSPLSDNSTHLEKTFASEGDLVVEQSIRKFVLEWSKTIFREWFKHKTIESQATESKASAPPKSKKRRGRRLKKMGDL